MVERLLHKKCHSATVDQIPSKYGVSIVRKWKHFVAIPIAGHWAALAVYDTCLRLRADNKDCKSLINSQNSSNLSNVQPRSEPALELYSRVKCRRHVLFQRSQHRKQFWRRVDTKKNSFLLFYLETKYLSYFVKCKRCSNL